MNIKNEHAEKLQDEVYERTQKQTLHRKFPNKSTLSIEHLKLLEDSHDRFTKHLKSTFHNINPFLTDAQELLDL